MSGEHFGGYGDCDINAMRDSRVREEQKKIDKEKHDKLTRLEEENAKSKSLLEEVHQHLEWAQGYLTDRKYEEVKLELTAAIEVAKGIK